MFHIYVCYPLWNWFLCTVGGIFIDTQLMQCLLLVISQWLCFPTSVQYQLSTYAWICLGALFSVPLVCPHTSTSLLWCDNVNFLPYFSRVSRLSLAFFHSRIHFQIDLSKKKKNPVRIFISFSLGRTDIFSMLSCTI